MKYLPYIFAGVVMATGLTIAGVNLSKSDVSDWSTTAADNDDADAAINFAENQTPASLNNSSRALMQQIRQWAEQTESQNMYGATTGVGTTLGQVLITPTVVPSSLTEGAAYWFISPTTVSTGGMSLTVASQTAATVFKSGSTELESGDVEQNQAVMVVYDGNNFHLMTPEADTASSLEVVNDTTPQLGGDLDLNGNNLDFPTTANVDDVIDDDTMAAADANNLATAESVKAYVDSQSHDAADWRYSSGALAITSGTTADVGALNASNALNEIRIYLDGVSTDTANQTLTIQIGDSGGVETSSYTGTGFIHNAGGLAFTANSAGMNLTNSTSYDAANVWRGTISLTHQGSNVWTLTGHGHDPVSVFLYGGQGKKTLSAALDRIRITTTGGTASFDAGTVHVVAR